MTDLSLDLKNSIADLQTRHAALITAVQTYRNGSVGASKAEITAAIAALEARLNAEESTLLGLAGRGVQPSLCLDFMKDMYLMGENRPTKGYNFADLVTFTRSSTGMYFNSAGMLTQAEANVPRFEYDPVTKVAKGLLIEESRTNLLLRSADFQTGSWVNQGAGSALTVTSLASNGPRGPNTMTKLARTDLGIKYMANNTFNSPSVLTTSVYAKAGAVGGFLSIRSQASYPARIDAWFNLNTGACGFSVLGDVTGGSVTMTDVGGGVWRCSATATAGATPFTNVMIAPHDAASRQVDGIGTVLSEVYVDAVQAEAGAYASSYIPTGTAQVTRSTDAASIFTAAMSPWFNSMEGTLFCDYTWGQAAPVTGNRAVELAATSDLNSSALRIYEYSDGGRLVLSPGASGGGDKIVKFLPITSSNQSHKAAIAYDDSGIAGSRDGADAIVSAITSLPVFNKMFIGTRGGGGQTLGGWIRSIRYYPKRLTNAQIKTLTS